MIAFDNNGHPIKQAKSILIEGRLYTQQDLYNMITKCINRDEILQDIIDSKRSRRNK
jgi:hypothetical protein